MQGYDATLKALITSAARTTLHLLGVDQPVTRWLNVELPKVQNHRVDLLAEIGKGELLHIELQSTNVNDIEQRMLEYAVGIWRVQGSFPKQIVLYVGNDRLRMPHGFKKEDGIDYRYRLVDIRDLDGEALLASHCPADNILAVLTGTRDTAETIRRILGRIVRLASGKRQDLLRKLLILSGMRGVENICEREEKNMPVDMDIMDHKIYGPFIRREAEKRAEKLAEKIAERKAEKIARQMAEKIARQMAEKIVQQMAEEMARQMAQKASKLAAKEIKSLLIQQIEKRFGPTPRWAKQRLNAVSGNDVQAIALKVVTVKTLEELFS